MNPGDYDLIVCPGPGEPHSLAIPKFPRVLFGQLIRDPRHTGVRVDDELRMRARWQEPPHVDGKRP